MLSFLSDFFQKKQIFLFSTIKLSDCEIRKPYLLEREKISSGTVVMIAVPYFTKAALSPDRNLSAYAVPRDYHGFFQSLFGELLPILREKWPEESFAGFADHSPIAELQAAAHAGLGVIGRNSLLLTKPYSSYVFLGELITTAELPAVFHPIESCFACGECRRACPMEKIGECLSAMTQQKGELTDGQRETLVQYGSAWGCDLCQEVCPYTKRALESGTLFSPIPYFQEQTIAHLTTDRLDRMDDLEFKSRAFAWRGRDPIRRNLEILESCPSPEAQKGKPC